MEKYDKNNAILSYDEIGTSEIELERIRGDANQAIDQTKLKLNFSGIEEGGLILDVGCGEGLDMIGFTSKGMKAVGLDISRAMLEACLYAHTEKGLDAPDLVLGDAEHLPFRDDVFDAIHSRSLSSFNILPVGGASATSNPLTVLTDMRRVSKIGGKIITMLPIHDGINCNFKPTCEEELKYMYRHAHLSFRGCLYICLSSKSNNFWPKNIIPFLRNRAIRKSDFIVGIGRKD